MRNIIGKLKHCSLCISRNMFWIPFLILSPSIFFFGCLGATLCTYWGIAAMQEVYERWLSCGEDWKKSSWALSLEKTSTERRKGARRWMTKSQIERKYESKEIAQEIVASKMAPECEHQRKRHPDLPHRDDHYLHIHQPFYFYFWFHLKKICSWIIYIYITNCWHDAIQDSNVK